MKRTKPHKVRVLFHSFDHQAWQKGSKYQPLFFWNFQNWCYKSSSYTTNEISNLLTDFPNLQNHLFLHVMTRWVMQTICFDFTNARHVIAGKISAKPDGRFGCHMRMQCGLCITITTFLLYVHSMFHFYPSNVAKLSEPLRSRLEIGGCSLNTAALMFEIYGIL